MLSQVSCAEAQVSLDQLCDRVIQTGKAVLITRPDGKNVALISEAELSSLLETLHLLRSPANATRLLTALERSQSGIIQPQTIDELSKKLGFEEDADDELVAAS